MEKTAQYRSIKKLVNGLLLLVILWASAGFVFWSGARKMCYEYVRLHRAKISARDTIILSQAAFAANKDIAWMKHDEISYRGQMFDIKKQIKEGERILLVGHYDKVENKLFKLLHQWLDDDNDSSPHGKKGGGSHWITEAVIPGSFQIPFIPVAEAHDYFSGTVTSKLSGEPLPPFHPPRSIIC